MYYRLSHDEVTLRERGCSVQRRTTEGATSRRNTSEDRNAPITTHHRDINGTA